MQKQLFNSTHVQGALIDYHISMYNYTYRESVFIATIFSHLRYWHNTVILIS